MSRRHDYYQRKQTGEFKLAFLGAILCLLTILCAAYCLAAEILHQKDRKLLAWISPMGELLFDMYAWIHPYLLLLCSSHMLSHFRAFLRCKKPEQLTSFTPFTNSNLAPKKLHKITAPGSTGTTLPGTRRSSAASSPLLQPCSPLLKETIEVDVEMLTPDPEKTEDKPLKTVRNCGMRSGSCGGRMEVFV